MEVFDEENKARLEVDGEEGDEETASVVNRHLNCHLVLAGHYPCHLEDWQHIVFEGGEDAQGGGWDGGGEEVKKISTDIFTFTKHHIMSHCHHLDQHLLTNIRAHHDHLIT